MGLSNRVTLLQKMAAGDSMLMPSVLDRERLHKTAAFEVYAQLVGSKYHVMDFVNLIMEMRERAERLNGSVRQLEDTVQSHHFGTGHLAFFDNVASTSITDQVAELEQVVTAMRPRVRAIEERIASFNGQTQ